MKNVIFICTMILLSTLLNSCGVIFGGSKFVGTVTAKDHPNAKIYINEQLAGVGEVTGLYYRNQPLRVRLEQENCHDKSQTFDKSFRTGNFILSVLTFGLVGLGVDLGTGASYKPAHNTDPDISKLSTKKFHFNVNYNECPVK